MSYSGLSDSFWQLALFGWWRPTDAWPKGKEAALKALEIDPNLSEAHASLAQVLFYYEWNWPMAEQEFKKAIGLSPNNALAHQYYSWYLAAMGRTREAIAEAKQAQEIDPLYSVTSDTVGWMFLYAREYDNAIQEADKIIGIDQSAWSYQLRGEAYLQKAMPANAISDFQMAIQLSGRDTIFLADLGYAYADLGKKKEALAIAEKLGSLSTKRYVPPSNIAAVYCALRDKDKALEWLEKAYEERGDMNFLWLKVDPRWDPIRSDPRFSALLKRMNLL